MECGLVPTALSLRHRSNCACPRRPAPLPRPRLSGCPLSSHTEIPPGRKEVSGRSISHQPSPQDTMPTRVSKAGLGPARTRGPPESPWQASWPPARLPANASGDSTHGGSLAATRRRLSTSGRPGMHRVPSAGLRSTDWLAGLEPASAAAGCAIAAPCRRLACAEHARLDLPW